MLLWWDVVILISHAKKVKKYIGELIFIGEISTTFLVPISSMYSSSNTFFQNAKRLFKGRGEIVKFICSPHMFCLYIEIYWSEAYGHFVIYINREWDIVIMKKSPNKYYFPNMLLSKPLSFLFKPRSIHFRNISRDPILKSKSKTNKKTCQFWLNE
jgi:hypothetical protein